MGTVPLRRLLSRQTVAKPASALTLTLCNLAALNWHVRAGGVIGTGPEPSARSLKHILISTNNLNNELLNRTSRIHTQWAPTIEDFVGVEDHRAGLQPKLGLLEQHWLEDGCGVLSLRSSGAVGRCKGRQGLCSQPMIDAVWEM